MVRVSAQRAKLRGNSPCEELRDSLTFAPLLWVFVLSLIAIDWGTRVPAKGSHEVVRSFVHDSTANGTHSAIRLRDCGFGLHATADARSGWLQGGTSIGTG